MKISQIEIQDNSDGELFFEIPPALLEDLGWEEGDKVKFIPNENGSFTIKKAKYSTIELDFSADELLRYMTYAHEKGMTFNELVEDSVKDFLIKADFENDEI
jgi:bifunctional DNA-binding transcriptional regulator/antitoxin component of YhaV-PrlF toxin-antitoxin module